MRLLRFKPDDAGKLQIKLREYDDNEVPPYIALSHRWGPRSEEVSFADMSGPYRLYKRKEGWSKIRKFCSKAYEYGVHYAWVDTCCIDKSSSTELSEAINSMFRYYTKCEKCFAYLEDIDLQDSSVSFEESSWFARAWTLQELIAPGSVEFFDTRWKSIGMRSDEEITDAIFDRCHIPKAILDRADDEKLTLSEYPIAQIISWAAYRKATRKEDRAYSLFGMLRINLPLLYGEGGKAFLRLQKAIIATYSDHSILMWDDVNLGMLARSPSSFMINSDVVWDEAKSESVYANFFHRNNAVPAFSIDNHGLKIQLALHEISAKSNGEVIYCAAMQYIGTGESRSRRLAVIYLSDDGEKTWGKWPELRRTAVKGHSAAWLKLDSLEWEWKIRTIYIID